MDCCLSNSNLGQLLSHNMGRISYRYVICKSTIRYCLPFLSGQLFLGYFSGPVEGIIMIIIIYVITGFRGSQFISSSHQLIFLFYFYFIGPSFWDQDLWRVTHLDHLPFMKDIPSLRLNESFMVFAGVLLSFNIIHRFDLFSRRISPLAY